MRSLNILHISDSHIQKKDEKEIREIVQKMIIAFCSSIMQNIHFTFLK